MIFRFDYIFTASLLKERVRKMEQENDFAFETLAVRAGQVRTDEGEHIEG